MLSPAPKGLFERLGGFDVVERAVTRCVDRLEACPALAALVPADRAAGAAWQVQLLLTELLGGPMTYDGPDPAAVRQALGIDATVSAALIEHCVMGFAESGADAGALGELRAVLATFAGTLGVAPRSPTPEAPSGPPVEPLAALASRAEATVAAAGMAEWPLFVLDADLVLVRQNPAATAALGAADADLRRAFGLGAVELTGQSVLRFHPAPTQLHGILNDAARLPREVTWCFGRTTWRARLFGLAPVPGQRPGFAMAWRDESAAHRRDAILSRLRAQAEELPAPLMYPQGGGELWQGNAACEHALGRLAPWLPASIDPLHGVPGSLFFPDPAERLALFEAPDQLPLKKRLTFGPETVSVLVSAVRDDEQAFLCPQVTWEIVHNIAPTVVAPEAPVATPQPAAVPPPAASGLRQEARALEESARGLLGITQLLDALADQLSGQGVAAPVENLDGALAEGGEILRQAERGVAALAAARQVADHPGRGAAVAHALRDLSDLARRTNQLVLDASFRAVEEELQGATGAALARATAIRQSVTEAVGGLGEELQRLATRATEETLVLGRVAELRDALREVPVAAVPATEAVTA